MAGNNTFKNASAAPVSSSHKYRPLDLSTDEIRLLTLHPGSDGDEISCILSHHNLTDNIEYEALSYTWGDNASLHTIILDGLPFRVTANLKIALHHLRHTDDVRKNRVLWIDALCINQQDPKERGHQVRQMDKIFSSACNVLAWLGEARDGSDIAMDFIKRIAQGLGLFGVHGEPFTPKEIWVALHKLWDRPYWGRVWIIQELASAIEKEKPMWIPLYHAEIGCGYKWLRLNLFRNAWNNLLRYLNHPLVRGEGEYVPVRNLFTLLFEHAHRRLTLSDLISLTYTANATDPRDHFYAVLGLAPETDRSALIPDYTKSLKEICGQFIEHIINTEKRLDILAFDHSSCKANLPTWAPNFMSLSRSASIGWRPYWHNFRASGEAGANPPQVQFLNDLTTLTIRGFIVDTVVTVDGPFTDVESFIRDYKNNLKASLVSKKMQDYLSGAERTLGERLEHRLGQRLKHRLGQRLEHRLGQRLDQRLDQLLDQRLDQRLDQLLHQLLHQQLDQQLDQLSDQQLEHLLEQRLKHWRVSQPQYKEDPLTAVGRTLVLDHHLDQSLPIAKRGTPDSFRLFYQTLLDPMNQASGYRSGNTSDSAELAKVAELEAEEKRCFDVSVRQALESRCFFTTSSGFIGLGPRDTRCGYYVTIFLGGNMPFIIKDKSTHHCLVGEAYVHGIMDGERMIPSVELQEFHLK